MTADPLDTTVPIRITLGPCRFEDLAQHWPNSETVAEQVRRATHDDMVLWARQQYAARAPRPVVVPLVGRRPEPDPPTEPIHAVQLVAATDPLPWVQPTTAEMEELQALWDDDGRPSVATRATRALTRPFRSLRSPRGVHDRTR
jgi:hypothetical protein